MFGWESYVGKISRSCKSKKHPEENIFRRHAIGAWHHASDQAELRATLSTSASGARLADTLGLDGVTHKRTLLRTNLAPDVGSILIPARRNLMRTGVYSGNQVLAFCKKAYASCLVAIPDRPEPGSIRYRELHGAVTINGIRRTAASTEPPLGSLKYRQSSCFVPIGHLSLFIPKRVVSKVVVAQIQHVVLLTTKTASWPAVLAHFWTKNSRQLSYQTIARVPAFKAYLPIACVGPRALIARDFDANDGTQFVVIPLSDRCH
jgi:hypothetical protein